MTSPFICMEGHALIMLNNSDNHAANLSTAAQSAKDLGISVMTVEHTSVQDAMSGDQGIWLLLAPPSRKHRKHGKEVKSGWRWWRTGQWITRHARSDGWMSSKHGEEYQTSQMRSGWSWRTPLPHPHHPLSLIAPTSSVSSAAHHLTPPFSSHRSMSVTLKIGWGVMIQTLFLYGTGRHLHIPKHSLDHTGQTLDTHPTTHSFSFRYCSP